VKIEMPGVKSRVTMVTGAGRGIGKATAQLLSAQGAKVMAVARSEHELKELGLDYVVADLGTQHGCEAAVKATEEKLGPVEILICNHGLGSAHEKVIWEQEEHVWRETMSINLDGPYYLTRLVIKNMVDKGYGRFVYTSSTSAESAEFAGSAYNSSKCGLIGLMRSVAQDGGPHNITSNAILPGWVRTPMAEKSAEAEAKIQGVSAEDIWKQRAALYPPGRVATPEEVAATIAFLASEEASGVSSQSISVSLGSIS
jgi:NAD(P)-dependent dehydrogenase (short-subunit alcohol dehydrogenase family)